MYSKKQEFIDDYLELYYLSANNTLSDEFLFKKIAELDKQHADSHGYAENVLSNIAWDQKSAKLLQYIISRIKARMKLHSEDVVKNQYYYDLANTILNLENLHYSNNHTISFLAGNTKYSEAIKLFSIIKKDHSDLLERALTNTANTFDSHGRNYEALQIYNKTLIIDPNFGMALGNKARALLYYWELSPYKSFVVLDNAKHFFKKALKDPKLKEIGGTKAISCFKKNLEDITTYLKKYDYNSFKKFKFIIKEKLNRLTLSKHQKFVLQNDLFLNYDLGYYYDEKSIQDNFFPSFIENILEKPSAKSPIMNERIYYLWHIFNQIFEDYTTARFNFFQALNINVKSIDKKIMYIDIKDNTKNSLKNGMLKSTLSVLYNCLDKIAHLIRFYFTDKSLIGINTYFYEFFTSVEFQEIIEKKNNFQLLALKSLAVDFREGNIYWNIRSKRNLITHSFLEITQKKEIYGCSQDELIEDTKNLFYIVKAAIMYSVIAINTSSEHTKKTSPKYADFQS